MEKIIEIEKFINEETKEKKIDYSKDKIYLTTAIPYQSSINEDFYLNLVEIDILKKKYELENFNVLFPLGIHQTGYNTNQLLDLSKIGINLKNPMLFLNNNNKNYQLFVNWILNKMKKKNYLIKKEIEYFYSLKNDCFMSPHESGNKLEIEKYNLINYQNDNNILLVISKNNFNNKIKLKEGWIKYQENQKNYYLTRELYLNLLYQNRILEKEIINIEIEELKYVFNLKESKKNLKNGECEIISINIKDNLSLLKEDNNEIVIGKRKSLIIDYGNLEWKRELMNCLKTMTLNNEKMLLMIKDKINLLKEYPIERKNNNGLSYMDITIDSLTDSCLYHLYYPIMDLIEKEKNVDDKVFDYLYGLIEDGDDRLIEMRTRIKYWLPIDLKINSEHLIDNHLIMSLYQMVLINKDLMGKRYYFNSKMKNVIGIEKLLNNKSKDVMRNVIYQIDNNIENVKEKEKEVVNDLLKIINFYEENKNLILMSDSSLNYSLKKKLDNINLEVNSLYKIKKIDEIYIIVIKDYLENYKIYSCDYWLYLMKHHIKLLMPLLPNISKYLIWNMNVGGNINDYNIDNQEGEKDINLNNVFSKTFKEDEF